MLLACSCVACSAHAPPSPHTHVRILRQSLRISRPPLPSSRLVAARRVTASARRRIGTAASRGGDDGEWSVCGAIAVLLSERRGGGRRPSSREPALPPKWPTSPSTDPPARVGRIEIITGPMFAGKSTELLRRVAEHRVSLWVVWGGGKRNNAPATLARSHTHLPQAAGRTVAVISSSRDTRYADGGAIATHAGRTVAAVAVDALAEVDAASPSTAHADVVAIDEAQSLTTWCRMRPLPLMDEARRSSWRGWTATPRAARLAACSPLSPTRNASTGWPRPVRGAGVTPTSACGWVEERARWWWWGGRTRMRPPAAPTTPRQATCRRRRGWGARPACRPRRRGRWRTGGGA